MEENILICEDSLEGVFSAVYMAYEKHYKPEQTWIQTSEEENLRLFAVYESVKNDSARSEKVIGTLRKRFGEEGFLLLCYALASTDSGKATAVYRTIAKGLRLPVSQRVFEQHADSDVGKVQKLRLTVLHEVDHYYGFLRFRELENGVMFSEIHPKADVLIFVAEHFADRFPGEHFLICDVGRGKIAVHEAGKRWFLAENVQFNKEQPEESRGEKMYQELFRHFCHKIAIEERKNEKLQKNMLPLRFRPHMTEFIENLP